MRHVAILLDESGSMDGEQQGVVSGINEYINQLKRDIGKKKCRISLAMFDSSSHHTFFSGKLKNFPELKVEDYKPCAMTPLYDSIAKVINSIKAKKGDKVVVVVDTDGYENRSKEHTQKSIKSLVSEKKAKGWAFIFMATGIDEMAAGHVAEQSGKLGMSANTVTVAYSSRDAQYVGNASATSAFFSNDVKNTNLFEDKDLFEK